MASAPNLGFTRRMKRQEPGDLGDVTEISKRTTWQCRAARGVSVSLSIPSYLASPLRLTFGMERDIPMIPLLVEDADGVACRPNGPIPPAALPLGRATRLALANEPIMHITDKNTFGCRATARKGRPDLSARPTSRAWRDERTNTPSNIILATVSRRLERGN